LNDNPQRRTELKCNAYIAYIVLKKQHQHNNVAQSTMERLFSPCNRLRDILESQGLLEEVTLFYPEPLQELNLNVSIEELLGAERTFTFADLYAMLGNGETVAWLPPHAAVVREHGRAIFCWRVLDESYRFHFSADGNKMVAFARFPEHLLEIVDVVVRLLAVSVVQSLYLSHWKSLGVLINAPALTYLMEQCQSLKVLSLANLEMDENHCRVVGAFSRSDLEIQLILCKVTSAGANALAVVLGRDQGPTKLDRCEIDNFVLANGLRGNSRLKSWIPRFSNIPEVGNREVLAIAGAVKENKGLVFLDLTHNFVVNDETWEAICASLETHPTLEVLNLYPTSVPAVVLSQVQALVDMLKVNTSIHTIRLHAHYCQHELFRGSVIPYLNTNRFRPRLLAVQRSRPIAYRAKVLGRALLAVRTDLNRFWMLLSGNAEVAFPSTTATIAAVASLPTPATAAATTTTATVAAAVATISPATAASCVVTPVSGQKRKGSP
jgi:hypothetical protein